MYQKLVGYSVKVVHIDGSNISVTRGVLKEYDESLKTISIETEEKKIICINALKIDKLEVMEDSRD